MHNSAAAPNNFVSRFNQSLVKSRQLGSRRSLTIEQQISNLLERGMFGQIFHRVDAIEQTTSDRAHGGFAGHDPFESAA